MGGMYGYLDFANRVRRPAVKYKAEFSSASYALEIERTFDCVGDEIVELSAIEVRFRGKTIYQTMDALPASAPLKIAIPDGVELGENELAVTANRDLGETSLAVMRVTLFQDDVEIRTEAIVSEPDLETVSGTVSFTIEREASDE